MDNTDNMSGENPGVLIKVNGNLVPCDKHLYSLSTNTELALKWVNKEMDANNKMLVAIYELMDKTLTIEEVRDYLEAREEEEGE
jgi:hypothetical protein